MKLSAGQKLSHYQGFIVALLRKIPAGTRGKHRLARIILPIAAGAKSIVLNDSSRMQVPDLHEPVAFCSLIDGQYEPDTLALIKHWMQDGGNFIDVGANVGALSLPMAKYLKNTGKVLSIEGSPTIADYLKTSLELNKFDNMRIDNVLCGESFSDVEFYQAPESHFGMGSRGAQFDQAPITLAMKTLDELAAQHRPVRAIKVDVEGFEYQVFAGAKNILSEDKPAIVFEFCDWADARNTAVAIGDAQRLLMAMGYKIWTLDSYLKKISPLSDPLLSGYSMLVAEST